MGFDHDGQPIVTMQFDSRPEEAAPLWQRWIADLRHRSVIPAIEPGLLRYAAINWRHTKGGEFFAGDRHIASLGLEVLSIYEHVIDRVGRENASWFANPLVKVDLEDDLRVAFLKPVERRDDRSIIVAIGLALDQLVESKSSSSPLMKIIARCLHGDRTDSFLSLGAVKRALERLADDPPHAHSNRAAWRAIEQGIGFRSLRDRMGALQFLQRAVAIAPTPIATELRDIIATEPDHVVVDEIPPWPLSTYSAPVIPEDPKIDVPVPRLFENAYQAQQPTKVRSAPIVATPPSASVDEDVERLLRKRAYRVVLERIETWLANAPDEPRAHHLRGKALLALGRLSDARAAFDRACALRPQLLEAMLLRREVDRVTSMTQAETGSAKPMTLALPDHLAELRDVLVSGRIVDAIQMLRRPAYDDDPIAQLLLAELLCTDDRHDDALAIYDRLDSEDARLGKARALLALARPAEALDALAPVTADEAYELRSRVLGILGRDDEAGVQMSTYLRLIEQRSDRRIGSR
ncbi:MAG TPA: tetratricopeptide repeat protein [Kofleriaceae bacterium]|nr:tetratricopeptide repeat protein [Kofleriaceae bacterium]